MNSPLFLHMQHFCHAFHRTHVHMGSDHWVAMSKKACQKCCTCSISGMEERLHVYIICKGKKCKQHFRHNTHYGKNDLFEGVRVRKNERNFLRLPVIYIKNTACKKNGPNGSFQPSGVAKAIYNGLYEVATTN